MIRHRSFISLLFTGLISLSLSFSTVHSHSAIQASVHESNHPGIVHSIEQDATFCPVCGYLLKAHFTAPLATVEPDLSVEKIVPRASDQVNGPHLIRSRGRSPPADC